MERIEVGRYQYSQDHGWAGWINPEREGDSPIPRWALFVRTDGRVALGVRNEETGELNFATDDLGPGHPRTFTGEEAPA